MMKLRCILSLSLILLYNVVVAQSRVKSIAYDTMLSTLLSHSVSEISVEELIKKTESLQLIDAREKREYDVSHLKNAHWVGYNDFNLKRTERLDKQKPVVVYCSVGYRSEKIAEQLKQAGFKEVYNLYGGIFEWVNQGQPIYNNNNQQTENIHAYDQVWGIWLTKGNKVYK
jgi:rhodanese-related sulfurtransferase